MDQEKIGKFIAKHRKEKNLTQEQLAEKLGVNSKSISRWENGRCMPDISLLIPLSKEIDMSVNDLLSGKKVEEKDYKATFEKNILNVVAKVDKSNKRFKLIFKVLLIVLIIIPILCTMFCIVDYNRAKNGKEPLFSQKSYTYMTLDVWSVNLDEKEYEAYLAGEYDPPFTNEILSVDYIGLGYRILTCELETVCDKPAIVSWFVTGFEHFSEIGK